MNTCDLEKKTTQVNHSNWMDISVGLSDQRAVGLTDCRIIATYAPKMFGSRKNIDTPKC
jgi:hypothetical protein